MNASMADKVACPSVCLGPADGAAGTLVGDRPAYVLADLGRQGGYLGVGAAAQPVSAVLRGEAAERVQDRHGLFSFSRTAAGAVAVHGLDYGAAIRFNQTKWSYVFIQNN